MEQRAMFKYSTDGKRKINQANKIKVLDWFSGTSTSFDAAGGGRVYLHPLQSKGRQRPLRETQKMPWR